MLFPIGSLVVLFVFGFVAQMIKDEIDPDMINEDLRRAAVRSKVLFLGAVWLVCAAVWWYQAPLLRYTDPNNVNKYIQTHRPR